MNKSRKIDKIKPETLLQLVRVVLEVSPKFKYISGTQPFLMSFAGKEYYVYVKNVSSAYFEDRDKTTRAQLPIKPEFNEIKASTLPFIFLGYDADNDVLICWNFHVAKRRLNAANSVSFYSRAFFQEEVKPGEFLRKMLKNGDRPVLFKRRDLVEFFNRIDTFFPVDESQNLPDSDIAARGSFNYKNVFQKYFEISNLSQKTCNNYTQALSGRVSDGISYYITNEPIDIFYYNDINLLERWKNQLFKTPEYIELDETGKKMYSCALEKYIQFHRALDDGTLRLSDLSNDEANNIMPFRHYLEQQGKSKEIIQSYIEALSGSISKYISDIVNREVNIFTISDRKQIGDWTDQLLQDSCFMQEATTSNKILGASIYKYFVFLGDQTNQDGVNITGICESEQTEIEEEVDAVKNGKLLRITNPGVINIIKPLIESNRNLSAAQEVGKYYAEKYPNMTLVDWMNLVKNTAVSLNSAYQITTTATPIPQDRKKKKLHILRVTLPNGDVIEERIVARTLVKVIEYAGIEKVGKLGIVLNNVNLISDTIVPMYAASQKAVGNGLYVMTCCDTETKHKIISQISDVLNLDMTVEKISIV